LRPPAENRVDEHASDTAVGPSSGSLLQQFCLGVLRVRDNKEGLCVARKGKGLSVARISCHLEL
jgi:hypothetical protein